MGGGVKSSCSSTTSTDDRYSFIDDDKKHGSSGVLGFELEEEVETPSGFNEECDLMSHPGNLRRLAQKANIMKSYINSDRDSLDRIMSLNEAILSYTPGSWIDKDKGEKLSDFDVPKATTLLVVGFKGSGKSSLINRISRVFEDEKLASDRAQVSYCSSSRDGTRFLHGYMIPRGSSSFCLFDTPGFSDEKQDNDDLIKSWMTNGVCNGELVTRESDNPSLKDTMKRKIRDEPTRKVNFVIFAVDAISVLEFMNSSKWEDTRRAEMLAQTYSSPHLSFGDDKPVIVVTRGDLLSHDERARVRIYLGELLGVPPATQIFDIPETDSDAKLATLEMLKYSLEHADKNLPHRSWTSKTFSWPSRQELTGDMISLVMLGLYLAISMALILAPRGTLSNSSLRHIHDQKPPLMNRDFDIPITRPAIVYSRHQGPDATIETDEIFKFDHSSSATPCNLESTIETDQTTASDGTITGLMKRMTTKLNLGSIFNYTNCKNKASLLLDFGFGMD